MIIACEPVCHGFEHALVNAAVLLVIAEAFPDRKVVMLAEQGHIGYVASDPIISRSGISFEPLAVPLRNASSSERFKREFTMVANLFEIGRAHV